MAATVYPAPTSLPATASPKPANKGARLWWHVHQWVGLKLSLFMAFIMLTGTLATVSHEIDWLLQPSLRVAPSSVSGEIAWAEIGREAATYPEVAEVISLSAPTAAAFAATAMVKWEDGKHGWLHFHPTTGQLQGIGPWVGAQRFFRNLHRHLNLPTKIGVPIVSLLSVLLLISLVTSFIVYKKWWRGLARSSLKSSGCSR